MKKPLVLIALLYFVWLTGCGGSPTTELQNTTFEARIPTTNVRAVGEMMDRDNKMYVVHPAGIKVNDLHIGPAGEILLTDYHKDTIYRLNDDGTLVEYVKFPGFVIDYFNVSPDGSFWFINNMDWGLYHVDQQGTPQLVANEMNRKIVFDSKGNLYAVDLPSDNVQKITPDGRIETIASGFQSQRIGVAPDDSVYIVTFNNELAQVEEDGSLRVIDTGYGIEDNPAFTPDGTMYIVGWGEGLRKVDPATGKVERLEWYEPYRDIGGTLVFDQQGIGYIFHPNQPLYRMDLDAQTLTALYEPYGNSWALGVDPQTETAYVAYGDRLPGGETTLLQVELNGELVEIGKVPYGMEVAMTFSSDGTGYLAVGDHTKGAMIYSFSAQGNDIQEFIQPQCFAQGMAVEPKTGTLWWTECSQVASYKIGQEKQTIPFLDGVNHSTIAFSSDGTLYALIWLDAPEPNLAMEHGIYRYDNGNWTLIKDMTAKDPGITLAQLTICPDDHIYVAASVDGEVISPNRDYSSMSALLRLIDDSSLELIGFDLGNFDPLAIACAPSGTVYFTNGEGIYNIPNLGAVK